MDTTTWTPCMFCETGFDCDIEFMKLLSRSDDVDLAVAALEIARDGQPGLDFSPALEWIEDRARELAMPLAMASTERDVLDVLVHQLAGVHGLQGDDAYYTDPEGSYLNKAIESRRGLPITLSVLYITIARRAGLELHGVCSPMHFLVRYESMEGPLFLDPYHSGRIRTEAECVEWLSGWTGVDRFTVERSLDPVRPRAIVVRMLTNLKALFVRSENWAAAWNAQHRLTVLNPSCYSERRDLARIALRARKPGAAYELLQCCLKSCPDEDREALEAERDEAAQLLARCN